MSKITKNQSRKTRRQPQTPRRDGAVPLNLAALDNKLRASGLKQWWLAERIGVSPKTVNRWLTGQVRRVQHDSLAKVATELGCSVEDLIDDPMLSATEDERAEAAHLIESEKLEEILAPEGRWPLLESLLKAVLKPDLPLPLLGRLYNQLSIAAWRQSSLDRADLYAARAFDIALRSKHQAAIAEAKLNLATLAAFRGRLVDAIRLYEECLAMRNFLDDQATVGKALSNLGYTAMEYGDLVEAQKWQQQAIDVFTQLKKPFNLAIAEIGMAQIHIELGQTAQAHASLKNAEQSAKSANYLRAFADIPLLRGWIFLLDHDVNAAGAEIATAQSWYQKLRIDEGRTYRIRASLARHLGKFEHAAELLARGRELATDFPIEKAEIVKEEMELMKANKNGPALKRLHSELKGLYRQCGAVPRLATLK